MDISQLNFEYLRLRHGPEAVQHTPDEIKKGTGAEATRNIFYNTPLDNFEKQHIMNLETELIERGISLPTRWTQSDTLRYLYSSQFTHEKAIEKIKGCMEWRNNPLSRTLTREVLSLYESGAIYLYGRDKQYRPIIVVDFGKIDLDKVKGDDFNAAMTILLDISINYFHLPGKVENSILLLDTRNLSITKLPIAQMKSWIAIGNACFPNVTFKTYVIGPPFMIRMSWKLIEGVLGKNTASKIEILAVDELNKLNSIIEPSQVEQKFGGTLPNLVTYWPPKTTFINPPLSRKSLHDIDEVSNEGDPSVRLRTMTSPTHAHAFHQSLPASHARLTDGTPSSRLDPVSLSRVQSGTPRLEPPSLSRVHSGGNRRSIFDKSDRASFRANHSPMRVREGDEDLINDILAAKVTPSVPNFQRKSIIPPSSIMDSSSHLSEMSPSFTTSRENVKRASYMPTNEPYESAHHSRRPSEHRGSFEGTTLYPDTTFALDNGDLMGMIMQEDHYLKGAQRGKHVSFKDEPQHFEPKNTYGRSSFNESFNEERHTQKAYENSFRNNNQETQKKSRPVQPVSEWQQESPSRFDSSRNSYQSAPIRGSNMTKNPYNDGNGKYTEEWSTRKRKELPRKDYEDELDDEETWFCGLCVSNRKKEGSLRKRY